MSWTPPDQCPKCHGEVIWGITETGKRMPLDPPTYPRDDETATAAVFTDHLRRVRVRILRHDRPLEGYERRAMPHFATCPVERAQRAARAGRAVHPTSRRPRPRQPVLAAAYVDEFTARRLATRTGDPP